jgi:NAD(P)-dependent dehydrogenase (short-subunit alcohol dehydrogenase family)
VGKAGLHALTRNLAIELALTRCVSTRSPRPSSPPIYEKFIPKDKLDETLHSFDSLHPLGRVGTARDSPTPSPSAPAISWVTGAIWDVARRRRMAGRNQTPCALANCLGDGPASRMYGGAARKPQ